MPVHSSVKSNVYFDSLVLMQLTSQLENRAGVCQAVVMMGTEENKISIRDQSLLTVEAREAAPDDLFIVVEAETEEEAREAVQLALDSLEAKLCKRTDKTIAYATLDAAIRNVPEANLVSISVPGRYAFAEARRALDSGLHVFIFSDNVPIEQEVELKERAESEHLLLMGPDCGTAILGGAALGFANAVRPGSVGIVGASGTGLQEATTIIHRLGCGITQAIGAGTNDVSAKVGGRTLIQGIRWFAKDPATKVILVVSKPCAPSVSDRIRRAVSQTAKPVVMSVLGSEGDVQGEGAFNAETLEQAALLSASLTLGTEPNEMKRALYEPDELKHVAQLERSRLASEQVYYRGLFCGGTYANESALLLRRSVEGDVYGNISLPGVKQLDYPWRSIGHTCVDMGDDVFTVGRPHPILAPNLRSDRLLEEAADPSTAVICLDLILGYGAHPSPAVELATGIEAAKRLASDEGRHLSIVVNVCGVNEDPQNRTVQVEALRDSGAIVAPTNAAATQLAAAILTGQFSDTKLRAVSPTSDAGLEASSSPSFELPEEGEIDVINDGLNAFAQALRAQGVPVTHVDFRPPAAGDEELANLLSEML